MSVLVEQRNSAHTFAARIGLQPNASIQKLTKIRWNFSHGNRCQSTFIPTPSVLPILIPKLESYSNSHGIPIPIGNLIP